MTSIAAVRMVPGMTRFAALGAIAPSFPTDAPAVVFGPPVPEPAEPDSLRQHMLELQAAYGAGYEYPQANWVEVARIIGFRRDADGQWSLNEYLYTRLLDAVHQASRRVR